MNKLSKTTEKNMFVRIISALAFAAICIPLLLFGGWFTIGLSFVAVGLATYEILTLPGKKRYNAGIWIITYITVFCLVYWQFLKFNMDFSGDIAKHSLFSNYFFIYDFQISIIGLSVYLIILFVISFFWENFRIEDIFYLFTMVFLISVGFYAVLYCRFFPVFSKYFGTGTFVGTLSGYETFTPNISTSLFLFFVIVAVFMSDIGAYFAGVLFGKHPMNVRISPHKTWEGFIGGVLASLIFSFTYVAISNVVLKQPLIPNVIDVSASDKGIALVSWGYVALFALLIPILDNVGGFLFSSMKRRYNAKDWGKLMPGHGGIIDRLDGVLITCTAMSIFVHMMNVHWSFMA